MTTPKIVLPEWAAAQASPWASVNQALFDIDQLIQISVLDMALSQGPGSEAEGDAYIVAAPATGNWAGQENALAYFINGAYRFKALPIGTILFNQADGLRYSWNGSAFSEMSSGGGGSGDQTLSIAGNDLTISDGNTVTIPSSGGGGAGNYFFPKNVSDVNGFPTEVMTGTETGAAVYNPSRGLTIYTNGVGIGYYSRLKSTTQPPTGTVEFIARLIMTASNTTDYQGAGFCLRNSVNQRHLYFGLERKPSEGNLIRVLTQNAHGVYDSTVGPEKRVDESDTWLKVDIVSTGVVRFHSSRDGIVWVEHAASNVATYLEASGGGVFDQIGFSLKGGVVGATIPFYSEDGSFA